MVVATMDVDAALTIAQTIARRVATSPADHLQTSRKNNVAKPGQRRQTIRVHSSAQTNKSSLMTVNHVATVATVAVVDVNVAKRAWILARTKPCQQRLLRWMVKLRPSLLPHLSKPVWQRQVQRLLVLRLLVQVSQRQIPLLKQPMRNKTYRVTKTCWERMKRKIKLIPNAVAVAVVAVAVAVVLMIKRLTNCRPQPM